MEKAQTQLQLPKSWEDDKRIQWMNSIIQCSLYPENKDEASILFTKCLEANERQGLRSVIEFMGMPKSNSGIIFYINSSNILCLVTSENMPKDLNDFEAVYFMIPAQKPVINETECRKLIEWGMIHGNILKSLEYAISLYTPVIIKTLTSAAARNQEELDEHLKSEAMMNLQKFEKQIKQAYNQLSSEIKFELPNYKVEQGVPPSPNVLKECIDLSSIWIDTIVDLLNKIQSKIPADNSPFGEIEYWRERASTLTPVHNQLQAQEFQAIVHMLSTAQAVTSVSLEYQITEVERAYVEAKENHKFLSTLEHHFKSMAIAPIQTITEQIPGLMNALKMIWIISRHYNKDERMVPLMMRIAQQMSSRVSQTLNVKTIFKAANSKQIIQECRLMLETWQKTYFEVRQDLETSGRDQRWEFDRKKLFEQTNYIAARCMDFCEIIDILAEFTVVFNDEMKSVTGDAVGVDDVLKRCSMLVYPIEQAPFDVFNRKYQTAWDALLLRFRDQVKQVEEVSIKFIDNAFVKLRSAQGALDLLRNIQNVKTRDGIQKRMLSKFTDILIQYGKEVDAVAEIFSTNKGDPPLPRFQPPVSGSINWCRLLFLRIKKSLLKFKDFPELLNSEDGKIVGQKFVSLAKQMKQFEQERFQEWVEKSERTIPSLLKQPILSVTGAGEKEEPIVNFPQDLLEVIRESRQLDRIGFPLPQTIMNVALQEEKYRKFVVDIRAMTRNYMTTINGLEESERKLMSGSIQHLKKTISHGQTRLNWNCLGIVDFINKCQRELVKFQNILTQTRKNSSGLRDIVDLISTTSVFPKDSENNSNDLNDIHTFFESLNTQRNKVVEALVTKYKSSSQLLLKIETLLFNKNSRKCPQMKSYYQHWEVEFCNALTSMVVSNLQTFLFRYLKSSSGKPAFQLNAILSSPEIATNPLLKDVHKMTANFAKSILELTKLFFRWQHGSCILTVPINQSVDEEPISFTFFNDIINHPEVSAAFQAVSDEIQSGFQQFFKYLETWRKYRPLWKVDKAVVLERFSQKNPTWLQIDEKMMFYAQISDELESEYGDFKDVAFVRFNLKQLKSSIIGESRAWIKALAALLTALTTQTATLIQNTINKFQTDLLNNHERALREVQIETCNVDQLFYDLHECRRLFHLYKLPPPEVDEEALKVKWFQLLAHSSMNIVSIRHDAEISTQ